MKSNLPEKESRTLSAAVEIRAEGETKKVFGYAAKFGTESSILENRNGEFVEVIEQGAFDDVLNDDVRALFNHDPNHVLARSRNGKGSLSLGVDSTGLWYSFEIPDTQVGRDLRTSIERKDIDSSSFGFIVARDHVERRADGVVQRTIKKVRELLDVSPVTYPAYPDATVALRSLDAFQKGQDELLTPSQEELSEVRDWAARLGI